MSKWIRGIAFWAATFMARGSEAGMVSLNATADGTSAYYEYFSDGFARMNLREPPPNEFKQRFHAISNPSVVYGQLDVFPHDEALRFGQITYDDSTIVGGTGVASITNLELGITADPLDISYLNVARFVFNTVVTDYSGTVTFANGNIIGIDLEADVKLEGSVLASTTIGVYNGTFFIKDGNRFTVDVEGDPVLDTIFTPEGAPVHLQWDLTGVIDAVQLLTGDINGDGFVGQDDLNIILSQWGQSVPLGTLGDIFKDGFIGQDDLNLVLGNWGEGAPSLRLAVAAVPEASSLAMLAATASIGGIGIWRRRSKGSIH